MIYLSWAVFAEGGTDIDYLSVLLPRIMTALVIDEEGPDATVPEEPAGKFGVRNRGIERAAEDVCDACDGFHLFFVHGDTGSPAQEAHLANRTCALCDRIEQACAFGRERCVVVAPRRETEAWCLADKDALRATFGIADALDLGYVPDDARGLERLDDPKAVCKQVQDEAGGARRRRVQPFPYAALAQYQRLDQLRRLSSYRAFEGQLKRGLRTLGYPNMA